MSYESSSGRASPNYVSTAAIDKLHAIAPFDLKRVDPVVWPEICAAVLSLPRTRVLEESASFLRVECRSAVFRFIDDLELGWRAGQSAVTVRSASRIGYHDFGVNRRRVEKLRRVLQGRGIIS